MAKVGSHGMALLAVGLALLCVGLSAVGQDGVMLIGSTDALVIETDFYTVLIDLAHGGSLTTLNPRDERFPTKDIVDNFRIQVVIDDDPPLKAADLLDDDPEGAWIWHGGPGFPPCRATSNVLWCAPSAAIVRVTADFKQEVAKGDWRSTDNIAKGVKAEITYYFFNTRMFFVTWRLCFDEGRDVRRASIEAIPAAFEDELYPRRWAYWGVDADGRGALREGLFEAGWTYVTATPASVGDEYWSDTWGTDLGIGRIVLDIDQLMPQQLMELCAQKPPNIKRESWTGIVDSWINVPSGTNEVWIKAGTSFSATILYAIHMGDYTYMQLLYHTLREEIPDLKMQLEGLYGAFEDSFKSYPFPQVESREVIDWIERLANRICAVDYMVEEMLSAD